MKAAALQRTSAEAPTIVERPDGYYWLGPEAQEEFGPYESYELAEAAASAVDTSSLAPGETLHEVERESGVADWVDAEADEPAEGETGPHLREEE